MELQAYFSEARIHTFLLRKDLMSTAENAEVVLLRELLALDDMTSRPP